MNVLSELLNGYSWKLGRCLTQIWQIYGNYKAPRGKGATPPILNLVTTMGVTTLYQGNSSMYLSSQENASAPAKAQTRWTIETSLAPTRNRWKLPPSPCAMPMGRAVFTHGPKGPGARTANFQRRHIKKSRWKYRMRGEKRLSTREKFKWDLY
jgi:hypothetical protein